MCNNLIGGTTSMIGNYLIGGTSVSGISLGGIFIGISWGRCNISFDFI